MDARWDELDLEFEISMLEDFCMNRSPEQIDQRCSQYKLGTYQWALWLMEKGEGYGL